MIDELLIFFLTFASKQNSMRVLSVCYKCYNVTMLRCNVKGTFL